VKLLVPALARPVLLPEPTPVLGHPPSAERPRRRQPQKATLPPLATSASPPRPLFFCLELPLPLPTRGASGRRMAGNAGRPYMWSGGMCWQRGRSTTATPPFKRDFLATSSTTERTPCCGPPSGPSLPSRARPFPAVSAFRFTHRLHHHTATKRDPPTRRTSPARSSCARPPWLG
jgi:hypothetical protein